MALNALLAMAIAGCDEGVRFGGPSPVVQNDSAQPIVMRIDILRWAIGPGEIRTLKPNLPVTYGVGDPVIYEILDAESCEKIGTVQVDFVSTPVALIVIPVSGPATVAPAKQRTDGRVGQGDALESHALCSI